MITYMFKSIIRDKETIFYIFLFPLFMLTIYALSFSGLANKEVSIKLAAAPENTSVTYLERIPMIELTSLTKDQATEKMKKDELVGFIENDTLFVRKGGFHATIAKTTIDTFRQVKRLNLPVENYQFDRIFTDNRNPIKRGVNGFKVVFYTFFAMVALQSAHISMNFTNHYRANRSFVGQRIETSPAKKHIVLLNTVAVSLAVNFTSLLISILYCEFILHIPLIVNVFESIAILFALNLLGVTFGICVGAGPAISEGSKIALITGTLLILGMLSGMMSVQFKNFLTRFIPWIDAINPMALFSNAMLRINISGDSSLFLPTLLVILLESLILFSVLVLIVRRRKYDYI